MRRVVPLLAVALVLVACDEDVPTDITPPSPLIQDANQNGGNPAFYWLAPIVQNNLFGGVFNAQLKPRVSICRLDLTLDPVECAANAPLLATWTLATGLGLQDEKYHVNWHTDETATDFTATYRIQVFLHEHPSAQRLGVADVQFFSNGKELKNINTEDNIPLHDGRTLPIQFRIEKGASCEAETDCGEATIGAGGGTVTTENGFAGVEVPAGAVDGDILIRIRRVDPETQAWGRCLPTGLRQEEGCYEFDTEPSIAEVNGVDRFNLDVVVAVCVDPAAIREDKLLLHKYDPENPATGVVALEGSAEDFLTCDEFAFQDGSGLFARFAGAAKRLLSPVARLVGATPLYAKDAGRGGVTDAFSFVGWAEPLELSLLNAPVAVLPQTAVPATILGVTEHNHGDPALPASDHVLRYDYTDPAGAVAALAPDTTDAAGHSAPGWTLTDQIGLHVVEVSTRMEILVDGEPFLVPDETVPLLVQVGGYESADDCAGADDCGQAIVGPSGDTLVTENADAGVAIPAGALASPVLVTIRAVDPSNQPWGRCLPTGLRQEGLCYEFDTEPSLAVANDSDQDKFLLDVVVAVCLDPAAIREDYLVLHKYDPEHPDSGVVALDGAAEDFLSCPGDIEISSAGGFLGRVARAVTRLVTPRPLYAKDAGRGGVTDAFSFVGWAEPVDLSLVGSLPEVVLPASALNATIQATTEHNHTNDPLDASGHTLRLDYTDPAGAEETLASVLTGANGQATTAWTLTSAVGVHALDVSTRLEIEIDGEPFLVPDPTPFLTLTVSATPPAPEGIDVDGVMGEGEWAGAVSFEPVVVNLPSEGTTQATIWVTNDAENLYIAVRYEVDLSEVSTFTSLSVRFDENVNNEVECGEDGLTVWIDGEFFDHYFECAADPPQHQQDTGNDGSEDGATATGFHGAFTVVELSHPLNSGDPLDFSLTAEDVVGLIIFTNIGQGEGLVRTDLLGDFPSSVPYTVQ